MTTQQQKFTFFWRDGKREVLTGSDPASALNQAGYGNGALRALDFYSKGCDRSYQWNNETKQWVKR